MNEDHEDFYANHVADFGDIITIPCPVCGEPVTGPCEEVEFCSNKCEQVADEKSRAELAAIMATLPPNATVCVDDTTPF